MPTDPSDPTSSKPSTPLYQTDSDAPKGGGGGIFIVILLLLVLGGGAAYYFMIYKPGAAATAALPPAAAHTPTPKAKADKSGNPTYSDTERKQYIEQADKAFVALRDVKTQPFTDAFKALLTTGGFSAAGLTSKDTIAARRDLVAKCQTANDGYEEFVRTEDATFKAELQKTPLVQNDVDYVLSDFSFKAQTDPNIKLRDLQRESLQTGDQMLAYLDTTFGSWMINAAQHLAFKKPADSAAFGALQKTYAAQVTEMNNLQAAIKATADPNSAPAASASPGVSPSPAASASPEPTTSLAPAAAASATP